jgi:cytosine deaminase
LATSATDISAHLAIQKPELVLHQARLPDGRLVDLTIDRGLVVEIADVGTLEGVQAENLAGFVLMPSLVEPHAHLDKAFTADTVPNPAGSLAGAIEAWLPARLGFKAPDIAARAWTAASRYLAHGTTAIRAHVDTGEGIGLRALNALTAVRRQLGDLVDLQIVALCSRPVTGRAGAENRAILKDALAAGADLVGGAPAIDTDPLRAVDTLAEAAAAAGVGLDLHVDETIDRATFTLSRLIEIARGGFDHPITASHAVSLGVQSDQRQRETSEALAELAIGVVTLPQTNLFLQGRDLGSAAPRGLTAVRRLLDAGVVVAAGGDNLQDPFNPMGRCDPLETASLLVVAAHLLPSEALQAVSTASRTALGLPGVSLEVGLPADLVAVRAASAFGAIASGSPERIVFRKGRVVARTTVDTSSELAANLEEQRWA